MPTKNKLQKSLKGNERAELDKIVLDELVRAIEGKVNKKGMTKAQARKVEDEVVSRAINNLQGKKETITPQQLRKTLEAQNLKMREAEMQAQYVNVPVPLEKCQLEWQNVAPNRYIRYEQFNGSDVDMNFIVDLFTKELTEPYSSFTYQHFVFGWPDLCIIAYGVESSTHPTNNVTGEKVGAIVSRVTRKAAGQPLRGYVAMFAVVPHFRGFRLGGRLVALAVELMKAKGCDEVYLETPTNNDRALSLYLSLGFVKTKFLPRYYLDHTDAVRLKLWLKPCFSSSNTGSTNNLLTHTHTNTHEENNYTNGEKNTFSKEGSINGVVTTNA